MFVILFVKVDYRLYREEVPPGLRDPVHATLECFYFAVGDTLLETCEVQDM